MKHRRIAGALVAVVMLVACGKHETAPPAASGPPPAQSVIMAAVAAARAEHKVVLIEFGASWCVWCKSFNAFVHAPETASVVASNYVVVNLTVQERGDKIALENPGGTDAMKTWGGETSGLPFYVFLDADGKKIADSNALPDGTNVGFPGNANELQIFLHLLDTTAPRLTAPDRDTIVRYLNTVVKSLGASGVRLQADWSG
jgi:thiol-disulfide isomerase/thioredoxin